VLTRLMTGTGQREDSDFDRRGGGIGNRPRGSHGQYSGTSLGDYALPYGLSLQRESFPLRSDILHVRGRDVELPSARARSCEIYRRAANRSLARISSRVNFASSPACPASSTMTSVAVGHARWSSHALPIGA
jgi:hypothetical protein